MMKIIRKLQNREAVSPVIGVILMVAITVAMAAALFFLINNMLGESDTVTPDIIIQKNLLPEQGLQVVKADFNLNWDDIIVTNGAPPTVGVVTAGDFIPFTGDENSDTMQMIYGPTNALIGSWQFGAINGTGGSGGDDDDDVPPPIVTQVDSSDTSFGTVEEGDLLVVMPNTRTGTWTGDALTCTATGYTTLEVAAYRDDDSDRRAVAILIREADGTEDGDTVSCSWSNGASTYATIYQIYRGATTWTYNSESGEESNGGGALSTSIPTISGLSTSTTANVLSIGALVVRDSPGTVTITNLAGQDSAVSSNCFTFTEFTYGDAVTTTDMSWTTARLATGILLQIECTD